MTLTAFRLRILTSNGAESRRELLRRDSRHGTDERGVCRTLGTVWHSWHRATRQLCSYREASACEENNGVYLRRAVIHHPLLFSSGAPGLPRCWRWCAEALFEMICLAGALYRNGVTGGIFFHGPTGLDY